jgi:hypothetical protein
MIIDKIIAGELSSSGKIQVAAIANKVLARKKWQKKLNGIPKGIARTRSLYSATHTVILARDAQSIGIPIVAVGYIN